MWDTFHNHLLLHSCVYIVVIHSKNGFCSLDKDLCHVNPQRRKQVLSVSVLPSPCNKVVSCVLYSNHMEYIGQMKLLQGHNHGITVI